jgi:hypothetical protein
MRPLQALSTRSPIVFSAFVLARRQFICTVVLHSVSPCVLPRVSARTYDFTLPNSCHPSQFGNTRPIPDSNDAPPRQRELWCRHCILTLHLFRTTSFPEQQHCKTAYHVLCVDRKNCNGNCQSSEAHRSANSSTSSQPLRHLRTSGGLPLAVNALVVTITKSKPYTFTTTYDLARQLFRPTSHRRDNNCRAKLGVTATDSDGPDRRLRSFSTRHLAHNSRTSNKPHSVLERPHSRLFRTSCLATP